MQAAMQVFGSKGYHAGSLADVAEQVGITQAGVLHHFGSKDLLLQEVLRLRDRIDVADVEGHHMPGGRGMFSHLERTAEKNARRRGVVQAYTVLTAEAVTDGHSASDWARERFAVLRAEIVTALRDAAADGGGPTPSEERLSHAASSVIGVMDGLQIQWLLDPDAVDLSAATAFAIDAVLATVLDRPGPTVRLDVD
ncbi:transcriptional regulator, TetR family [Beutenbergia cavernae DSM 12333]|uniref:Transcriptional regulator, TetR family n=1 Tax=Beutenbergia cavernae (strain ATCC BAA-8 / DSM 12333 / CCUG 43141 / JCM 11478 / NBRC 16432 / NCIMB 13614 / HKI 0122) TaxID=471853 RepID=C5BYY3_BEUC1|nr:transcriptional regulator, TetR family [Beutenbergia cavernae DSM 12333]